MKRISYIILTGFLSILFTSCDKFLDVMPDNRTEIDSKDKIKKLLVSAYAPTSHWHITEFSSDNVDDNGRTYSASAPMEGEAFNRTDFSSIQQDSPQRVWDGCYKAIASSNQALKAIEELGNENGDLDGLKGEALITRAYNHFILVNVFCQHYSPLYADQDLGIPYMEKPETTVSPHYERGTVAEVYAKIQRDIETAIPLIDDDYDIPAYHFTRKAAWAFAARFYLYYLNYDEVIRYATLVLSDNPENVMRDWATLGKESNLEIITNMYVSKDEKANLFLRSATSAWPYIHGPYSRGERYAHGTLISESETLASSGPWGSYTRFHPRFNTTSSGNKVSALKFQGYFEFTDPVAQTGYVHIVQTEFTTEEILLCRAEAYILKGEYDKALADLNIFLKSYGEGLTTLTLENINKFYNNMQYFAPTSPTAKKRLNPDFTIVDGTQENLLHCLLHLRRIVTLHEGLRWFDVKRYGIEVHRRLIDVKTIVLPNPLLKRDNRCALQIPASVISGGLTPNPR